MDFKDFRDLIDQMKETSIPRRMVFIWIGLVNELENSLEGIEMIRVDLASAFSGVENDFDQNRQSLELYLNRECQTFESDRNEPSALIIGNGILLARYGCDLSPIFRHGISPRAAVIIIFPNESQRQIPPKTDGWVKRDTKVVLTHLARQLGELDCIVKYQEE